MAVPESPIPDLPPRAPGVVVSARVPSVTEKYFLNEKDMKSAEKYSFKDTEPVVSG